MTGTLGILIAKYAVTALAGERIWAYASTAWKVYRKGKAVKQAITETESDRLLRKLKAAGQLTAKQKAALTPEELAILEHR